MNVAARNRVKRYATIPLQSNQTVIRAPRVRPDSAPAATAAYLNHGMHWSRAPAAIFTDNRLARSGDCMRSS